MSDVLDLLRDARDLIAVPERWTQRAYARDAAGLATIDRGKNAVSWCSSGAIFASSKTNVGLIPPVVHAAHRALEAALPDKSLGIGAFNDHHSHADVLALFDRAIRALEAEEVSA